MIDSDNNTEGYLQAKITFDEIESLNRVSNDFEHCKTLFSDICPDDSRINILFPQHFIEIAKKKSFASRLAKSGMKPFIPQEISSQTQVPREKPVKTNTKGSLMSSQIDNAMNMVVGMIAKLDIDASAPAAVQ